MSKELVDNNGPTVKQIRDIINRQARCEILLFGRMGDFPFDILGFDKGQTHLFLDSYYRTKTGDYYPSWKGAAKMYFTKLFPEAKREFFGVFKGGSQVCNSGKVILYSIEGEKPKLGFTFGPKGSSHVDKYSVMGEAFLLDIEQDVALAIRMYYKLLNKPVEIVDTSF